MRAIGRSLAAAVVAGLLAGCAALADLASQPAEVVDTDSIIAAERAARAQGNQVIWLRYPTKPATAQPK